MVSFLDSWFNTTMKISSVEFVGAAAKPGMYPKLSYPEIAFAGRSNVGKSSLINRSTGP